MQKLAYLIIYDTQTVLLIASQLVLLFFGFVLVFCTLVLFTFLIEKFLIVFDIYKLVILVYFVGFKVFCGLMTRWNCNNYKFIFRFQLLISCLFRMNKRRFLWMYFLFKYYGIQKKKNLFFRMKIEDNVVIK